MFDLAKPSPSPVTLGSVLVALALLSGCGAAAEPRPVALPASGYTASPSELPPGAMDFSFDDSRVRDFAAETPRARLRPERSRRPRHLLVH